MSWDERKKTHTCSTCETEFEVNWNDDGDDKHPLFCPFCAAHIDQVDEDYDEPDDE